MENHNVYVNINKLPLKYFLFLGPSFFLLILYTRHPKLNKERFCWWWERDTF